MRIFGAFVLAVLLVAGFLTRNGGGASASSGGALSRQVDATPATVLEAVRDSLRADGFELVSRADNGDHFRQVIPAHELSRDPKFARIARLGDLVLTARVDGDGAEIHTGFTAIGTAAGYNISVVPGDGGEGSVVSIASNIEEGSGPEAERMADNLRIVIDQHARRILDTIAAAAMISDPPSRT